MDSVLGGHTNYNTRTICCYGKISIATITLFLNERDHQRMNIAPDQQIIGVWFGSIWGLLHLSVSLSLCLSVFRLSVFLSFCHSVFPPFCLSVFLSFCLFVFLSFSHLRSLEVIVGRLRLINHERSSSMLYQDHQHHHHHHHHRHQHHHHHHHHCQHLSFEPDPDHLGEQVPIMMTLASIINENSNLERNYNNLNKFLGSFRLSSSSPRQLPARMCTWWLSGGGGGSWRCWQC